MPRRPANVNLTDTRRAIRACRLEGVDFRMTLQPGGAVVIESAAPEMPPAEPAPVRERMEREKAVR